jgi:hypothetical protein
VTRAKISEYSATANDNTDVNGVDIAEGCPPSSMNNMGREIMAALKRFQVGSDGDGVTVGGALVVSGATTLTTVSATVVQSDTVSEKTSAAGVTIDGVLLKDSGVVTGAGTVSAPVYSTTGDTNTGIFFPAADTIAFAEGGAEAMRINSSGNVGIGTTSPGAKLNVLVSHTETDVTTANSNSTLMLTSSGTGNGVYNALKFAGNQQDMYIMSFNNGTEASRRLGFFVGSVAGDAAADEKLSILGSGNVGIGTTSPGSKLDVSGLARASAFGMNANGGSVSTGIAAPASSNLGLYTNTIERARIDSSGNLLVNTTNQDAQIDTTPTTNQFTFRPGDGIRCSIIGTNFFTRSGDGTIFNLRRNATTVGTISVSGSSTAYNTSSDYRLKENIAPMTGALAKVAALKPCTYTWKADGSAGEGFIAHELAEVCPDAVTGEKDATEIRQVEVSPAVYEDVVIPAVLDEDGNKVEPERIEKRLVSEAVMEDREFPVYQGVDTSFLVATLTAALQELSAKNDALEARLSALEQA